MPLHAGGYIGQNEVHKVFNPDWGGYAGIHQYPLVEMAALTDRSLTEWIERGALYAIVRYQEFDQLPGDVRSGILPLRTFPPDDSLTGPAMVIVRLTPVQHEVRELLGYVQLAGYDLSSDVARAGDTIEFRTYWRTGQALPSAYHQFNHLLDSQGRLVAQVDGPPAPDPRRTTDTWNDPHEIVIGSQFPLTLPADLRPGLYQLVTGFYRLDTGERLVFDGLDLLSVFELRVR